MDNLRSLRLLPMVPNISFSGYEFVSLLSGARTTTPMWQELSGAGILQRLRSERGFLEANLAPSESCLLQCQKFRSRGCIHAFLELGLTSFGSEVVFFRPTVSCDTFCERGLFTIMGHLRDQVRAPGHHGLGLGLDSPSPRHTEAPT